MFPVRYEHHLHKKGKAIPVTGLEDMFPVRYEHHLYITGKAIPVTGQEDKCFQ
jgi:hypothetical protein